MSRSPCRHMTPGPLLVIALMASVLSAMAAEADKGKLLFSKICATCHGGRGEGRTMGGQSFPTIAGLPAWYVELQLQNFRQDVRGAHGGDTLGLLMRPIARSVKSEQAVKDVATYIEQLPRAHPSRTVEEIVILKDGNPLVGVTKPKSDQEIIVQVAGSGEVTVQKSAIQKLSRVNLEHGATLYKNVCAACHGDKFQGNPDPNIKAPSHKPLGDWYMLKQLQNFSSGVRGTHAKDVGGAKMVPIAKNVLKDMAASLKISQEEASASVVAYIFASREQADASLPVSKKP